MGIGLSGLRGRIAQNRALVAQKVEAEHVLILLQSLMENHARVHQMLKKDAINTHVQSMETGWSGLHGQRAARNAIMVREREVEHVLILPLNTMDNPVMVHPPMKEDAINTHAR